MAVGDLIHPNKFDPDRGGEVRINKAVDTKVCMYIDAPGVFFTMSGHEVADDVAAGAGFDVAKLRREGDFERAKAKAIADLKEKFQLEQQAISRGEGIEVERSSPPIEVPLQTAKTASEEKIRSTPLHEMKHRGRGKWDVFESGSDVLVLESVDEETAVSFMLEQVAAADPGVG